MAAPCVSKRPIWPHRVVAFSPFLDDTAPVGETQKKRILEDAVPDQDPCEICNTEAATIPSAGFDGVHQRCPRCGEFKLAGTAGTLLRRGIVPAIRAKVSGWVRDQNRDDTVPMITSNVLQQVSARTLPTVTERAERLILEALRGQTRPGSNIHVDCPPPGGSNLFTGIQRSIFSAEATLGEGMDEGDGSRAHV